MNICKIISDGTVKGTWVLNDVDLPAVTIVKRVTIDIDPTNVREAFVRIEYVESNQDGNPAMQDGDFRVCTVYRKIAELKVKVHDEP